MGAAVSAASQFLIVVVVTRGSDAGTAGRFFTATALCLMAAGVLRLDSGNGLIYFIARTRRSSDRDMSRYFQVALVPVLVLSLGTAALAAGYADVLAATLFSAPAASVPAGAVRVLAPALPWIVLADVLVAGTRGFGSMRPTALLSGVLQPAGQLLLVAAVVLTGVAHRPLPPGADTGTALAVAWAAPALPVLLLTARWLRRRTPPRAERHVPRAATRAGGVPSERPATPTADTAYPDRMAQEFSARKTAPNRSRAQLAREFWRYTGPRSVGGAAQAVFQRLDIVLVAMLSGPEQAALYAAATRFKVAGQLVNQGFTQAVQPRLVRALAEGDLALSRRLYQTTTMWLVLLTWPVWLGYALLAPWVLGVFGDGYSGGAAVAVVLAATMMLATACGMADVVLIAAGRTAASMVNVLAAIGVTVALDVVLVPRYGALGAVLGWSGGMLVKNLLPLSLIHRRYGLRPFGAHSLPALRVWRPEETT
ncbi:hypothetical protein Sme01_14820 [Sphaerisporangium melleum]|uniref:Polysaccharide biosynthesis protein n=1 Tax=Sphaerisporangium melleum TaxID=321316 RepID=A0A917VFG3_9ACTN|nr:hypothetical protein GCM10007964_10420 [Sphaerisporangium melleum]GII69006.1 hypothetical protein Sme01_14820 [Sphaerisporangium melleum]